MTRGLTFALPVLVASVWPLPAQAQESADAGRLIAEEHCARCHVVGNYNPMGGIGSTPSFQLLVNYLEDWEARFATFHERHPHPPIVRVAGFPSPDPTVIPPNAAPFEIELEDIEHLIAFARTLKE